MTYTQDNQEKNPAASAAKSLSIFMWVMFAIPVAIISSAFTYYAMKQPNCAQIVKNPHVNYVDQHICAKK